MHTNDIPKDQHGFALAGATTVYGSHLAMFNMRQHRYHTVIQVALPPKVLEVYANTRKNHPSTPIIVVNSATNMMLLDEMVNGTDFSAELWELPGNDFTKKVVLAKGFTAKAAKVLHHRAFDNKESYPAKARYLVFGTGGETHVSHYMTKEHDYQLLADLVGTPTGLTATQLADGVFVDLSSVSENHSPASDPLKSYRGKELAATTKKDGGRVTLRIGPTHWFDTRYLNEKSHGADATLTEYVALTAV